MDVNTKIIRFIDKNDLISAQTFLNLLDTDEISNLELENSLYYASKVGKASFVNLLLEFSIGIAIFSFHFY
jgi:hypothetical protein